MKRSLALRRIVTATLLWQAAACDAPTEIDPQAPSAESAAERVAQDEPKQPVTTIPDEAIREVLARDHDGKNQATVGGPSMEGDGAHVAHEEGLSVITAAGVEVIAAEDINQLGSEDPPQAVDGQAPPAEPRVKSPFRLLVNPGEFETLIEVHPEASATPLLSYQLEPRVLRLEWNPERTEAEQVPDLVAMLKELTQELQAAFSPSSFNVQATYANYPSFAARLARAASKDAAFRKLGAVIRKGGVEAEQALSDYVAALASQEALAPELDEFFAAFGLQMEVEHVQACVSGRSHSQEVAAFRRKYKLSANPNVPLGCKISFKLIPMQPTESGQPDSQEQAPNSPPEPSPPEGALDAREARETAGSAVAVKRD